MKGQINNDHYTFNKKIEDNAYRLDYEKPFDSEKYKDEKLTKKSFSVKILDLVGDMAVDHFHY